jgi:hypothetical protein
MMPADLCTNETMKPLLDAGLQPVSNRYLRSPGEKEDFFPLVLGQCQKSGVIKLSLPFPNAELVPRYDWITYREPEGHLDEMVDNLCKLEGISPDSVIGGVSFKDNSTLDRFHLRGFRTWPVDPVNDLYITKKGAGAECIQAAFTRETSRRIVVKKGKADVLIVRHILEHVYNLQEFLASLKELVAENGYLVFEVPDCVRSLEQCDYSTIWEEHIYYFTPVSLKYVLAACGLELVRFDIVQYPFENSLIAVTRVADLPAPDLPADLLRSELERGALFARNFEDTKRKFRLFFSDQIKNGQTIAFFGAGHLACTFIWLFQLQEFIGGVIDDDPHKQGLFMPGSKLPIVSSSVLSEGKYSLCILSLNPLNEENVIGKFGQYGANGGKFYSIFPSSHRSLHRLVLP